MKRAMRIAFQQAIVIGEFHLKIKNKLYTDENHLFYPVRE